MRFHLKISVVLGIIIVLGLSLSMLSIRTLDATPKISKSELLKRGKAVYDEYCKTCHQADGKGMDKVFPPVYKSDFLAKDHKRNIRNIIFGLSGEITVNGKKYNGVMPPIPNKYTDKDVASVLTYVYSNFGNKPRTVQPEEVAAVRKAGDPNAKKSTSSKKKKKKKK